MPKQTMPEPTEIEKPPCVRCNPLPSPSINLQMCPRCQEKTQREILERLAEERAAAKLHADLAVIALERLLPVLSGRSGQSYKLRGLLYSLWNGQPYSLLEIVNLDAAIKNDLSLVIMAWGYPGFFYDEMRNAIIATGQWAWFLEAEDVDMMRSYVEAYDRRGE